MTKLDIVTGFLGAGKTTFIRKMLSECVGNKEKTVVIENEFGTVGIDGELVSRNGTEVFEIAQGCICCTLKEDFVSTMNRILDNIKPDRIIFEPSGIFVLEEIFKILKAARLEDRCRLNSIICIVDAVNFLKQRKKFSIFFEKQIEHANVLILSKIQYVAQGDIEAVTAELAALNNNMLLINEEWDKLTNTNMLMLMESEFRFIEKEVNFYQEAKSQFRVKINRKVSSRNKHHKSFETYGLSAVRDIASEELRAFLEDVVRGEYGEILRGKGFIRNGAGSFEFSYVNGVYNIYEQTEATASKMCFIGENIKREKLNKIFIKMP